jgi:hypothetical protein
MSVMVELRVSQVGYSCLFVPLLESAVTFEVVSDERYGC